MIKKEEDKSDPWTTTTWAGNSDAHLEQVLASSYEARFLWVCEAFDFLKDTLPSRHEKARE